MQKPKKTAPTMDADGGLIPPELQPTLPVKGRGTADVPANRFEGTGVERDLEAWTDFDGPSPKTVFLPNRSKSVISRNDSPDTPNATINAYRGCEHGCIYCYARPTHETFGFNAGLDFETKILVKHDAPQLLAKELASKSWKPQALMMSGVTDCYQPAEKRFGLTRAILRVLADFRNPVGVITKNHLITRDIDILKELAAYRCVRVYLSITSLRPELIQFMEPRTSMPAMRLKAISALAKAGIPVGVNVAPVVPGLTDHEMPAILKAAAEAGASSAGYIPVRLPYGVKDLFEKWLHDHFPDRAEKVLSRIRQIRGGKLNDPNFGTRMEGQGIFADQMRLLFEVSCKKYGIGEREPSLTTANFRRYKGPDLFES